MTHENKASAIQRFIAWCCQFWCLHRDTVVSFQGQTMKTVCCDCGYSSPGIIVEDRISDRREKPEPVVGEYPQEAA